MRLAMLPPLLFAVSTLVQAQSAPQNAQQDAPLTLRTQARLVVLDVVVKDKSGNAVRNLKQSDFSLTEKGSPQTVKSFEEHHALAPSEAIKFSQMPPLPAGEFTNFTPAPVNSAINVLLLDTLNTALTDQNYVRDQVLKYLKNAQPGSSLAIFGLSSRLYVLQGFTTNPELLRAAVSGNKGKTSPLLDDPAGNGNIDTPISDQISDNGSGMVSAGYVSNLKSFEADNATFDLSLRAMYTLNAMSVLARYLAEIPGRKNLIWFSGSFPINVLPSDGTDSGGIASANSFSSQASFQKEYRETTNLLARSRVAVYPVDARGLLGVPSNSASAGMQGHQNPSLQVQDTLNFASDMADAHATMLDMARDTGGRAYLNTNGLTEAVQAAIQEGSNYYTLAYTPTDAHANGDFRKIDIKLDPEALKKGYTLAYRKGYYSEDAKSPDVAFVNIKDAPESLTYAKAKPDIRALAGSMSHGMPNATQILYKVRIVPASTATVDRVDASNITAGPGFAQASGPFRNYAVDFAAPARQTTFTETPDGLHHASLEFTTLVFQADGKLVNMVVTKIKADLTDKNLVDFQRTAVGAHQQISVPAKGVYTIRTGIRDLNSNHLGALEIPVSAVSSLPPANNTATTDKQSRE